MEVAVGETVPNPFDSLCRSRARQAELYERKPRDDPRTVAPLVARHKDAPLGSDSLGDTARGPFDELTFG
jgi:hypothetical protein